MRGLRIYDKELDFFFLLILVCFLAFFVCMLYIFILNKKDGEVIQGYQIMRDFLRKAVLLTKEAVYARSPFFL